MNKKKKIIKRNAIKDEVEIVEVTSRRQMEELLNKGEMIFVENLDHNLVISKIKDKLQIVSQDHGSQNYTRYPIYRWEFFDKCYKDMFYDHHMRCYIGLRIEFSKFPTAPNVQ